MAGRLAHYRIVSPLGSGAAASVHQAIDERDGRPVALKLLHPHLITHPTQVRRFKQEAEWIAALDDPHVVDLYETGEVSGCLYMATELVHGQSLRSILPQELEPREAVRIAIGVCSALAAAHRAWIVHRDVKPENILLRKSDGHVKVVDFGLAKLFQPSADMQPLTRPGMVVGTPHYLAPEQILGDAADPRTDLFSLGVVLYEMLTCSAPFDATSSRDVVQAILREEPAPLPDRIGAGLRTVVTRALRKDPDERYQSATEMRAGLESLLSGELG